MASTNHPTSDFNIAIIGAGIGGLALAIGLTRLSIPFTIYESGPTFSAMGAGVGLGPNALRAMDLIDSRFRQKYMDIASGNSTLEKRNIMMEAMRMEVGLGEGEDWWGKGGWGSKDFERTGAHRKEFLNVMTSFIHDDAVVFNKRVSNMRQTDNSVSLEFEDGEVVQHAAVVGSDGLRGISRRIVLGERFPDCVAPKYTGKYVYPAIVPMEEAKKILGDLATDAKMYMGKDAYFSTYPISSGTQMNAVGVKRDPAPEKARGPGREVTREDMIKDFTSGNPDPRLVKLLDWARPMSWNIYYHPKTPTYFSSQICILGDAAHASGPHQGAGAGQSLEDALILSHVIGTLYRTTPSSTLSSPSPARAKLIEAAFSAYDEVRRPRAQRQVDTAEETGDIFQMNGGQKDMEDVVRDLQGRFGWIWDVDLEKDVQEVDRRFGELVKESGTGAAE